MHTVKVYVGSGFVTMLMLGVGTRWRWVDSFTPRQIYLQGKTHRRPMKGRLCGPQSSLHVLDKRKSILHLPEIEVDFSDFKPSA
jgi:hypothetical protein